jgi:excisionase family DNA binding protein
MSSVVEIRPGSVRQRELAMVEHALARSAESSQGGARLIDIDGSAVEVPAELAELLRTVVQHLKSGHGVSVAALNAELTTSEAAELLNVSRPHLIKQLEAGALAYRMVGSHRRVRLVDVLAFRDQQDADSRAPLDELTRQAEDLGLYE